MSFHFLDASSVESISLPAASLVEHYVHAQTMSRSADAYFAQLTSGIDSMDCAEWERQISHAEGTRIQDKSAMDILGAAKDGTTGQTAGAAATDVDPTAATSDLVHTWLQLALDVEEKQ